MYALLGRGPSRKKRGVTRDVGRRVESQSQTSLAHHFIQLQATMAAVPVAAVLACLLALPISAFTTISSCSFVSQQRISCGAKNNNAGLSIRMNLLDGIFNNNKLEAIDSLPYGQPFCDGASCGGDVRTFAIRERPISFTGEDFDVSEVISGGGDVDFARVRGAMLHLPGKDKMRIRSTRTGEEVLVLDRVMFRPLPSYDIFRGGMGAEKIGWIEKKLIAMTDTFDVYMEGEGGFGVTGLFKPKPAYQISGDFIDRNFVFKDNQDRTVAKVKMDGLIQFDAWNHYQVQIAPGMDAFLVLACCCAIDEEFDEEHEEAKKRREGRD